MKDEKHSHLVQPSSRSVALTGATGFIGQYVCAALLDRGWRVRALVRAGKTHPFSAEPNLEIQPGTLEDPEALRALVHGCEAIVHLAGAIRGRNYEEFAAVNVSGTRNLLDACLGVAPLARLVHISSLAAREPALSWYARSKRAAENLIAESGMGYSGLRPPAVYGPEDPAMAPLWRSLARGWLLRAGPSDARFSLLHARDLAEAVCRLLEASEPAMALFEIDDGFPGGYRYRDIADLAAQLSGRRVRILPVPPSLLRAVANCNLAAARLTGRRPLLIPGKIRELTYPDWVCDNSTLDEHLCWTPQIRLEDCLGSLPGFAKMKDE